MVYLNLAGSFIPDFLILNHSHNQTKFLQMKVLKVQCPLFTPIFLNVATVVYSSNIDIFFPWNYVKVFSGKEIVPSKAKHFQGRESLSCQENVYLPGKLFPAHTSPEQGATLKKSLAH